MEEAKAVTWDMKNNKSVGDEIAIQILKENEFTFEILTNFINKSIETGCFPLFSKKQISPPFLKKMIRLINLISGLLQFYINFKSVGKTNL